LITGTTDADRFCSARLLLLLALLCPLLPPLGHFALRLGASLGRAGKSALLARVKRAAAAGYANLLFAGSPPSPCLVLRYLLRISLAGTWTVMLAVRCLRC
jgi:hypothetical protein